MKRFPTLIIITLLIIIVLVFNILSMAFDRTIGSYSGGIKEMVFALRDGSNMVLVIFALVAIFWEIQLRLNWPFSPKPPASRSASSRVAPPPQAEANTVAPAKPTTRNTQSDAIRYNRYRVRQSSPLK
jgi:hypothetical protein